MKMICANLKMNQNLEDINKYITSLKSHTFKNNLTIFPSAIFVPYFLKNDFAVGVQNAYFENNGAYTGEISAEQIKGMGVQYSIVGHSERRKYFFESDEIISKKVDSLLEKNIVPIVCIGETKEEREENKTAEILKKQLLLIKDNKKIIIAYEPLWAIGTGVIPTEKELQKTARTIRGELKNVPLLYGGSVSDSNIEFLEKLNCFDGYLIGGASLSPEKLIKIDSIIE